MLVRKNTLKHLKYEYSDQIKLQLSNYQTFKTENKNKSACNDTAKQNTGNHRSGKDSLYYGPVPKYRALPTRIRKKINNSQIERANEHLMINECLEQLGNDDKEAVRNSLNTRRKKVLTFYNPGSFASKSSLRVNVLHATQSINFDRDRIRKANTNIEHVAFENINSENLDNSHIATPKILRKKLLDLKKVLEQKETQENIAAYKIPNREKYAHLEKDPLTTVIIEPRMEDNDNSKLNFLGLKMKQLKQLIQPLEEFSAINLGEEDVKSNPLSSELSNDNNSNRGSTLMSQEVPIGSQLLKTFFQRSKVAPTKVEHRRIKIISSVDIPPSDFHNHKEFLTSQTHFTHSKQRPNGTNGMPLMAFHLLISNFKMKTAPLPSHGVRVMGCFSFKARYRNFRINQDIKAHKSNFSREIRVLLTGPGESGKTTLLKQLQIVYLGGFSTEERMRFRKNVYTNIFEAVQQLCRSVYEFVKIGAANVDEETKIHINKIMKVNLYEPVKSISNEQLISIKYIWNLLSENINTLRRTTYILDSAEYFLGDVDRLIQATYVPTVEDIIRCRTKTTGISSVSFYDGGFNFKVFDVGGQVTERKKWIHVMDDITSVIFLVAINEYDQVMAEDSSVNRINDALRLFGSLVNSLRLLNCSFILFFNKIDLLTEDKLTVVPLSKYFTDYVGDNTIDSVVKYFKKRFMAENKYQLPIFFHTTCATDTNKVKKVFDSTRDFISAKSLGSFWTLLLCVLFFLTLSFVAKGLMGNLCSLSAELAEQRRINNLIDKQILDEETNKDKIIKILLLGSGESGKSTIVKQMKIIHQDGYSNEELLAFRPDIFRNLTESLKQTAVTLKNINAEFDDELGKKYVEDASMLNYDLNCLVLPPEIKEMVSYLWNELGVKDIFDQLMRVAYFIDSSAYFFDNVERIADPNYVPSTQDILKARIKTTGIAEIRFRMGLVDIHMFDVGGQRSERKKWIHCFENVTSVIYIVSLSEYDQTLIEDSTQNRLIESLVLFESIVNSRWFQNSSIVLFLNKMDIFEKKIQVSPINKYFPEYQGTTFDEGVEFIKEKFLALNTSNLMIYPHLTCATDTKQIEHIFAAVQDTILSKALKETGIL
ncbi:G-alpha-domain-containing protein [Rozella allomycis CSF55]|uniref:G-alpha-domain-containing protein n=1 Tax=Rozella allomycis (strain CSF55) TaxID=988480 RepID=A0A4P9YPW8_ROZAC|nr:G-alpha-domain-containing protein [Rozella allomycis CSF55]